MTTYIAALRDEGKTCVAATDGQIAADVKGD
jgi:hypothetical protein